MEDAVYKHLKDDIYYGELYDRFTIEKCRRLEESGIKEDFAKINSDDITGKKKPSKEDIKKRLQVFVVIPTALYFLKGERYRDKAGTIQQWMARDRAKDERENNAVEPRGVRCLNCSSPMDCAMRDLHSDINDKNERVLFFFECPKCHKRRAYWENGEEWEPAPDLCPKCRSKMTHTNSHRGNIVTTVYSCPNCGHKETDTWDFNEKKKEKVDPNFEADRKKYCMSEKEGSEYISRSYACENAWKHLEDFLGKQDTHDEVAKINKLTVAGLQQLLRPLLEKEGYVKFGFGKPQADKDVRVKFTVQDDKADRIEYDSRHQLKKLIIKTLADTNWRLMSDGINYRLGILTGHLRGYESEGDLLRLVK